jgi:hypothetical protein
MTLLSRWLAPAVLATGLGVAGFAPTAAHAQSGDELVRVIVDVADVIMRGGQPYYRNGHHGYDDRLVVVRDRYGRPVYYRQVPRGGYYDDRARYDAPRYGSHRTRCNKHGKCKVEYYDPRYDRRNDYGYSRWGDHRRHHGYEDRRYWRGRYGD